MITGRENHRFCGRIFTPEELTLIQEMFETCRGISRMELSYTVCELLEWRRANGIVPPTVKSRSPRKQRFTQLGVWSLGHRASHRRRWEQKEESPVAFS